MKSLNKIVKCVVKPALQMEFIVLVRLSPQQIPYYSSFTRLSNESSEEGTMNAVVAYATCAKIWNHPDLLYHAATRGTSP